MIKNQFLFPMVHNVLFPSEAVLIREPCAVSNCKMTIKTQDNPKQTFTSKHRQSNTDLQEPRTVLSGYYSRLPSIMSRYPFLFLLRNSPPSNELQQAYSKYYQSYVAKLCCQLLLPLLQTERQPYEKTSNKTTNE